MKRARPVTATELAECCVCEQRVVFDRSHGRRRTAETEERMRAGEAAHAALHQQALRRQVADGRCFVATALWGGTDPRTQALRAWRDGWLLKAWWGPTVVALYYWASPWLVRLMVRAPRCRSLIDAGLSRLAAWLARRKRK